MKIYYRAFMKMIKLYIIKRKMNYTPAWNYRKKKLWTSRHYESKIIDWQKRELSSLPRHLVKEIKTDFIDLQKANNIHWDVHKLIKYEKDIDAWEKKDYWQTSNQTIFLLKGDCEDQAFVRMRLLKEAGLPDKCLAIIIIEGHAFAGIYTDERNNDFYILDNGNLTYCMGWASKILPYFNAQPIVGFNLFDKWEY